MSARPAQAGRQESDRKVNPLLWVVLALAVLSCFFSLVGISLRSFRRAELEKAFGGPSGRRRLERLEAELSSLRLTVSLCRVACNLTLVVVLLAVVGASGGGWGRVVLATAAAVAIIAVFGLAIPHAWAAYAGEKAIAAAYPILVAVRCALWPITALMGLFDVPVRRLAGITTEPAANGDSAKQEILHAAVVGRAEGAVNAEEAEMIESVIEFGQTHAGEIMTPRTDIFAIPVETRWEDACREVWQAGHSRVPIYERDIDNIIGILYAKDLLEQVRRGEPAGLREIMRKCYFVPETKALDSLLREFKGRKVHIAVVLDEYGGTAGLVTIEDVLEEIVGDISDEYDQAEPAQMLATDERTVEADGRVYIDDLNDALEIEIPEDEDYDTVAGFVFSELGYIPAVGETLEAQGARFTILAADERKITRLRVERAQDAEEGEPD